MGAAENKKLMQDMFAELGKGNGDAFLGNMADDVQFTIIGSTKWSGTFKGKKELVEKLLGPLNAELEGGITITPDNFIADGDTVAMQAKGKATTKSGKSYYNTYCMEFKFNKDGKVQRVTEYLDTELVTTAFGK
jgi:ketosteroid isomerase-like protein